MSIDAFSAVLHHSNAVGTDKVVLLGIAWHMSQDPSEGCWPSIATLAGYANVSPRSVSAALHRLQELGELEVHVNMGPTFKTNLRTNVYFITIACENECQGFLKHAKKLSTGMKLNVARDEADFMPRDEAHFMQKNNIKRN